MQARNIPAELEVRNTDSGMEFVISTAAVDRHGTVINPRGWDLAAFRANPIMAFQHNTSSTDPDDILGTWDLRVESGPDGRTILVGKPNFEDADLNPKADKIRRKIEAGTLRAVSVGFMPIEYHWGDRSLGEKEDVLYLDRNALLEVSIVAVPSNPEALKRSMDTLRIEFKAEIIHEETYEEEYMNDMPDDSPDMEPSRNKMNGLGIEKARLIINKNKANQ